MVSFLSFVECTCAFCLDSIEGYMKAGEERKCCKRDKSWAKIKFEGMAIINEKNIIFLVYLLSKI